MSNQLNEILFKILANNYALYLKTQNYHWNIMGSNFSQLHLLLGEQYEDMAEAIDMIAERLRALNYQVPASFSSFEKVKEIQDGKEGNSWELMIEELAMDNRKLIFMFQNGINIAEQEKDFATVDLLTERIREHEKSLWMLKATLK